MWGDVLLLCPLRKRPCFELVEHGSDNTEDPVVEHFVAGCGSGLLHPTHIAQTARALLHKHPADPHYAFFAGCGNAEGNTCNVHVCTNSDISHS
jgi:hypothetical protein